MLSSMSISMLLLLLGKALSKKVKWNRELQGPFECGFSSKEEFRTPFSIHFFLVALVFVLFDVELVIFFPFMISLINFHSVTMVGCYISFVLFVTLGLINEWDRMALEWSK